MLPAGMLLSLLSLSCFAASALLRACVLALASLAPVQPGVAGALGLLGAGLFAAGACLLVAAIVVSLPAMRPGGAWQGGVFAMLLAVASLVPTFWAATGLPPFSYPSDLLALGAGAVFLLALDQLSLHNGYSMRPGLLSARPAGLLLLLGAGLAWADFAGGLLWLLGGMNGPNNQPPPTYPYLILQALLLASLAYAGASLRSFRLVALAARKPRLDNDRTPLGPEEDEDDYDTRRPRKAPPRDGRTDHIRRGDD